MQQNKKSGGEKLLALRCYEVLQFNSFCCSSLLSCSKISVTLVICILIPFFIMYILDTIKMFKIKSYTDKATIVLEDTTGWKPQHHGVDTTGWKLRHHGVETTTPRGGHHGVETTTPRGRNNDTTGWKPRHHRVETMTPWTPRGWKPRMETTTPRGIAFPV